MPPFVQLKSPFVPPPTGMNIAQGLDRKAEYLDVDGVPRRSQQVTRRMIQRGVSIDKAIILSMDEKAHTSIDARAQDTQAGRRATVQLAQEAERKRAANATLKYQAKVQKEKWIKEANQRAIQRRALWQEQQHQVKLAFENLVDLTENNTALSPSKTNTFVDEEGNLRRRISTPPGSPQSVADGFVLGPLTPSPPASEMADDPQEYC